MPSLQLSLTETEQRKSLRKSWWCQDGLSGRRQPLVHQLLGFSSPLVSRHLKSTKRQRNDSSSSWHACPLYATGSSMLDLGKELSSLTGVAEDTVLVAASLELVI